ncbi:MAG: ComEA family DNA-binding protein [Terriglobia bacterium]
MKFQTFINFIMIAILGSLLTGCTQNSTTPEQTREQTAEAAKKVKDETKEAAKKIEAASDQVKDQVKAVAQGAKEGWTGDKGKPRTVDLNTASSAELTSLPGIGKSEARRIIKARPFTTTHELVSRGILTEDDYQKLSDHVTVN